MNFETQSQSTHQTKLRRSGLRSGAMIPAPGQWKLPEIDLIRGLFFDPKWIDPKYFYDREGSRLYDLICETPEYYLARTETEILEQRGAEIAAFVQRAGGFIEVGAGTPLKSELILGHTAHCGGESIQYAAVATSPHRASESVSAMKGRFPQMKTEAVVADFTEPFAHKVKARGVVYFSGSMLGNFHPEKARHVIRQLAATTNEKGGVLLSLDMQKDPKILEAAYNDRFGVTEAFNMHLLKRINDEFHTDLNEHKFKHVAFYNKEHRRIEMHIQSLKHQIVDIMGRRVVFRDGETIHTENSYKYAFDDILNLARDTGMKVAGAWTDAHEWFSIVMLTRI